MWGPGTGEPGVCRERTSLRPPAGTCGAHGLFPGRGLDPGAPVFCQRNHRFRICAVNFAAEDLTLPPGSHRKPSPTADAHIRLARLYPSLEA
jgi:hypothetical protein